jgi:diaminopimelate epimerase
MVKVDMGEPIFEPEKIPVRITEESNFPLPDSTELVAGPFAKGGQRGIIDYPLQIEDGEFRVTCVSMGNPHTVIFIENLSHFPVTYFGPLIENHSTFPKKTNVEFVEVLNPTEIEMRVWERGSGETMACGTGASAAAIASNIKGLTEKNVVIHLLGGDLFIEWAGDNHVYMTGPAEEVFEGSLDI